MSSIVAAIAEADAVDRAFLDALGEAEVLRLHPMQTRTFTFEQARRVVGVYLGSGWHLEDPDWLAMFRPKWVCGRGWTPARVAVVARLTDAPLYGLDVDTPWDLLEDDAIRARLVDWLADRLPEARRKRVTGSLSPVARRSPGLGDLEPSRTLSDSPLRSPARLPDYPRDDLRVSAPAMRPLSPRPMPCAPPPPMPCAPPPPMPCAPPPPMPYAPPRRPLPPPAEPEPVRLDASAPAVARPGDVFLARFAACAPADFDAIRPYLDRPDGRAPHELLPTPTRWRRGARISVTCHGPGLHCAEATRVQRWDGEPLFLDFEVAVEPRTGGPQPRSARLGFDVAVEGVVLNKLRLKVALRGEPDGRRVGATARAPTTAFASHARLDQPRVADCCTALERHAGLDIFVDCLDLRPGERWWRRLVSEIDDRELFLLFWSDHAAASPNVEREWRHAFTRKAREAIEIHPLAPWPKLSVPPEFAEVHVASRYQVLRAAGLDQA